jgi:hypothetical protein
VPQCASVAIPTGGMPCRFALPSLPNSSCKSGLRLTEETYVYSTELRLWCWENRNRFYIPEWLLEMAYTNGARGDAGFDVEATRCSCHEFQG